MNKTCSIFSQMLQFFSRIEFQKAVSKHKAERHARGFTCWGQFIAMLFCQVGQAHSLREICGGLASCEGKLKHLGVPKAPKRSTLAYANEHRPWQLYQEVFNHLYQRCRLAADPRRKFRFRNPLVSIDATLIDLCASVFDWAKYRQAKGAAKLHLVLDHNGCLPRYAVISEGKVPEVIIAREIEFEPGTILVMDMGYIDYRWYQKLTDNGVFFVTRVRHDAHCEVVEDQEVPQNRNVLKDQIIRLGSHWYRQKSLLRRIEIQVPEWDRNIVLLTNNLDFGSTTISNIYRDRWEIEKFFRDLKKNLRIKTFVGTSANALKIQIWTALIAILLMKYLQLKSSFGWSLSNLVAMIRQQLFIYRDLWTWLNNPFDPPPALEQAGFQMELNLST
jgi:hypothetical protein